MQMVYHPQLLVLELPSFSLEHTLFVPLLSNNLLSVSHVTQQLVCLVLMYPNFWIFQDLTSKEIIRCDTKRGGFYYNDDVYCSIALTSQDSSFAK